MDREQPHSLDEDFLYKRPYGYTLRQQTTTNLNTWRAVYESLLLHLAEIDRARFYGLLQHPDMISNRGNATVSSDPSSLRRPHELLSGFFIETNYSANQIRDSIRRILPLFGIRPDELKLYLREDRDPE